jgi:hypothetical protein
MANIVALLTDFGTTDIYVGVMKGVMKSIDDTISTIDITHEILPQSIEQGSFALNNSYRYFPSGTVFLVVVDPGVGSSRYPIAIQAGGYFFVGPDNGVFTKIIAQESDWKAVRIENPIYQRKVQSSTFHGRDIFAPVAAHLAHDPAMFSDLGTMLSEITTLNQALIEIDEHSITGKITHIDHFGNLISNIGVFHWHTDQQIIYSGLSAPRIFDSRHCRIFVGNMQLEQIHRAYHQVPTGDLLVQLDSNGYVEIAVNQGNAQQKIGAKIGDPIKIQLNTALKERM